MKRTLTLALILLLALSFMLPALLAEQLPTVGILQYVQHPALDAARDGFIKGLEEAGFKEDVDVLIDRQNGNASQDTLSSIADQFAALPVDLVLAIATPAVQTMAAKSETIPILGTAVTDFVLAKLVQSNEAPGFNVSGTTDMNPVEAQIQLAVRLVPNAKTLGLLYTSSEVNSQLQAELARAEAEKLGLKVAEVTVNNSNDVQQAAVSILEAVDLLYVPTDNIIASSIALVAEEAMARKIPIVAGESGIVRGGATFTLGIDYFKLGEQTGHMAARLLKGEAKVGEIPIESQSQFEYLLNKTAMDELGLAIPEDLLPFAEDITP
ncbi:MAG: ABC transporter substrate-binding protein [Clostridiales bacterium]|nr:ABC transporter substrate-binding protein [Clostridiales bacterium]